MQYVQSLQEELQQKEVQLSQSARDLQTVEKDLKQTRLTMYSEQAQIAHLQMQVNLSDIPPTEAGKLVR